MISADRYYTGTCFRRLRVQAPETGIEGSAMTTTMKHNAKLSADESGIEEMRRFFSQKKNRGRVCFMVQDGELKGIFSYEDYQKLMRWEAYAG